MVLSADRFRRAVRGIKDRFSKIGKKRRSRKTPLLGLASNTITSRFCTDRAARPAREAGIPETGVDVVR